MNWTGGRLSRHSRPATFAANKQKQHFAQLKQSLKDGPRGESPARWTILNRVVEERTGSHWIVKATSPQSARAQHKQGNSSHPSRLGTTVRHSGKRPNALAEQDYKQHSQVHLKRDSSQEGASNSQARSSTDAINEGSRHSQVYFEKSSFHGYDSIYETSVQPRERKRKRETTAYDLYESGQEQKVAAERRRKLLEEGDWVGSAALVPPKVAFKSPSHEENVGRRRKITDSDQPQFESRMITWTSPFVRRTAVDLIPGSRGSTRRLPGMKNVQITIGGEEILNGASPGMKMSRVIGNSSRVSSTVNQVSPSSRSMLLDKNESSPTVFGVHKKQRTKTHIRLRRSLPIDGNKSWTRPLPDGERFGGEQEMARNYPSASSQMESYFGCGSDQYSPKLAAGQGKFRLHFKSSLAASSMSAIKSPAVNGQMAHSSSFAPIRHPKPQSSKVFRYFRSNSSDIAESTAARIGSHQTMVPRSELLNNEIWRTWIAPLKDETDNNNGLKNLNNGNGRISISPSISVMYAIRQDQRVLFDTGDHTILESPATTGSDRSVVEMFENTSNPARGAKTNETGLHLAGHENEGGKVQISSMLSPATIPKFDAMLGTGITPKQMEEDADKIWRRFVFGSDGIILDPILADCARRTTSATNSSEEVSSASMVAQHSVGEHWSLISVTNERDSEGTRERTTMYSGSSSSFDANNGDPDARFRN